MFFAHLADCHVGGWRDPALREINSRAFCGAISRCMNEKVDFVIIAGDLFNTPVPPIDSVRTVFSSLRSLKEAGIPCYLVSGSHDCSPSGRSMVDVIESAGLGITVTNAESTEDGKLRLVPTLDKKTGVRLCGIPGRSAGLDKHYYEALDRNALSTIPGPKIFVFHGSISELKPDSMEAMDGMAVSMLPSGFDYYAGGHVHITANRSFPGHLNVIYPGPTFPNNYTELETLGAGSFCLVRDWTPETIRIEPHPVISITVDVSGKSPAEATHAIHSALPDAAENSIVLLRVSGELASGSIAEIRFKDILSPVRCVALLRNTAALTSKEFESVSVATGSLDEIEERLSREHAGKSGILSTEDERQLVHDLMGVLAAEKQEGEKIADFERRVENDARTIIRY